MRQHCHRREHANHKDAVLSTARQPTQAERGDSEFSTWQGSQDVCVCAGVVTGCTATCSCRAQNFIQRARHHRFLFVQSHSSVSIVPLPIYWPIVWITARQSNSQSSLTPRFLLVTPHSFLHNVPAVSKIVIGGYCPSALHATEKRGERCVILRVWAWRTLRLHFACVDDAGFIASNTEVQGSTLAQHLGGRDAQRRREKERAPS